MKLIRSKWRIRELKPEKLKEFVVHEIDKYWNKKLQIYKNTCNSLFFEELPTVLIGKNGSGKTNVLEALSAIALANTNNYGYGDKWQIAYRAHIQLTEEDVATMLLKLRGHIVLHR